MSSVSSPTLTDRGIRDAEGWTVLLFSVAASAIAVIWSWKQGAMLNYGDAVAHLHIARRVLDSRTPRLTQLGSVWLPLPHILLIPFVQKYRWWATGFAGVIPSATAYVASCAGIHRLARRWLGAPASALALVFFALNPNLLYMQTTAMTEPLFLCEFIWIVVLLAEWRIALDEGTEDAGFSAHSAARAAKAAFRRTNRLYISIAALLVAAIFTRYDGWIIALVAWTGIGLTLLKRAARGERDLLLSSPVFRLASCAVAAAPILWFVYNAVGFGDWLYFARGPFSARAIELRAAPPGWPPHPGWHNLCVALLYYLKVSELDAVMAPGLGNAWGNIVVALAAIGTAGAWFRERSPARRRAFAWILLLWLPAPFYAWSVAYGSVPIFFPAWWPYTWYNTRYGLELLPALALGIGFAAQVLVNAIGRGGAPPAWRLASRPRQVLPAAAFAAFFTLAGFNLLALLREHPLVYVESTKNLAARLPYDEAIPPLLKNLLAADPRAPVLMNTSAYPEIVSLTGIPLRQTINESDLEIFYAALASPAAHAAIVVACDGDAIDQAVKAHPAELEIAGRFTAPGQPRATVYRSRSWFERIHSLDRANGFAGPVN